MMEKKEIYEKPQMKFVDIRNQKNVAAGSCWSQEASAGGKQWYYDYSGTGWVQFRLSGNCNASNVAIVKYFNVPESEMGRVLEELQSSLAQHEFNETYFNPDMPPAPGTWS